MILPGGNSSEDQKLQQQWLLCDKHALVESHVVALIMHCIEVEVFGDGVT